jgi:hypothetical protein
MMRGYIDMRGERLGELYVVDIAPERKFGRIAWTGVCSCGRETVVAGTELRRKTQPTRSCGCIHPWRNGAVR